jgi:catechol 2,3-dioxygenase-like lactoylglutathione lyase family enzyme
MDNSYLGIDHITLGAPPDAVADAREFFGKVLGMPELPVPEALRDRVLAWFRCGEAEIHVVPIPDYRPLDRPHPAFRVMNAEALEKIKTSLTSAGHAVIDNTERPDALRFFTRDPWGNRLEFLCYA